MAVTHPGEVAIPIPEPQTRRRRRGLVVALVLLVVLPLLLALAAVGTWVGYELAHDGKVFEGVRVAGVDVSGRTGPEAEALLATSLAGHYDGTVHVAIGEGWATTTYARLGRSTDVAATVAAAMAVGREGEVLDRLRARLSTFLDGVTLEPTLAVDPAPLGAWIDGLAVRHDRAATPAAIDWSKYGLRLHVDGVGWHLQRRELVDALTPVLADPAAPAQTRLTGTLTPITAGYTDIELAETATALRRMTRPFEMALGDTTWTMKAWRIRTWIDLVPSRRGPVPTIDAKAVAASLPPSMTKAARRTPVETMFLVTRGGQRIGYVAGTPGRRLDTRRTVNAILGTLTARQAGDATTDHLDVATTRVPLELTPEEAGKVVPEMVRIGTWTTYYAVSERNGFGANITIPARLIDRTLVRPGQIFDFWGTIGPVTYARGFRDGAIIVGGRSQPTGAIAGGICSASTTLFNAAARAGLQIVERDNHYYYIDRYPLGLDATVSKSRGRIVQNMRFRNDTDHDIFIKGSAGPGWVRFDIYSLPNGREVSFSRPKVWDVVPARDIVVRTSSLPRGTSKREEYPVQGMKVLVTRTVRENGRVIHRDDFYTSYGKVDGILRVGTG